VSSTAFRRPSVKVQAGGDQTSSGTKVLLDTVDAGG
jgi:hypothetical protein